MPDATRNGTLQTKLLQCTRDASVRVAGGVVTQTSSRPIKAFVYACGGFIRRRAFAAALLRRVVCGVFGVLLRHHL